MLASCPVDNRPVGAPLLTGKLAIKLVPGTHAANIYGQSAVEESFNCNYELNVVYRETIENGGLKVSGFSKDGGARIVEIPEHRFFMATGFVPQFASDEIAPHPLIVAYLEAARVTI